MVQMSILIYNWRDIKNPDAGGAEVFTHENAKRWVEKGNKVTLFTSAFAGCKREEVVDGVNIIRDGGRYSVYWKAGEYYKKYFNGNFDIVIDEINTRPFFTHKFVNNGAKVFALIHQLAREFWFHEVNFPVAVMGRYVFEERWLKRYKNIPTMTVSNSTKEDLIELGFKKIFVVPEGIKFKPLEKVPAKENEPTFIFVGRLKKAKKPQDALRAFGIVKKVIPNAKLWVVGDGYHRRALEKNACSGVKFFGRVSDKEKLELMSRAHAILVPGVREGWGLIVTEANACGTPAIAYDVPGLRDSVEDRENGILVGSRPEKMAEIMTDIALNQELRKKLSKNALEHSRQFSWDNSARETLKILEGVVNG